MIKDLQQLIENECRFCNPPDKERILYETKNFYVMLSLGPIVEGYILIVSKEHFDCCGALPDRMGKEFDMLYQKAKEILKETYGAVLCYEHGRAGSCLGTGDGSKHCFHAHMHLIPTSINLSEIVEKDIISENLQNLVDFRKLYKSAHKPYLYIDDGAKKIFQIEGEIRRQYLRFKTAEAIKQEHLWDWVTYQNWEFINSAKITLSEKFNK